MTRIKCLSKFCLITVALLILSACLPMENRPGKQLFEPKLEKEYFVTSDGAKLPVRSWLPEGASKAFYEHGYHMLLWDLEREKPLADIVAWIIDHNSPLPYGTENWN